MSAYSFRWVKKWSRSQALVAELRTVPSVRPL